MGPKKGLDIKKKREPETRCSPLHCLKTMTEVKARMGPLQREALSSNPFGHFIDMPKLVHSFAKVQNLIGRYRVDSNQFEFGDMKRPIPVLFDPVEVSLTLVLYNDGQTIDINLKTDSSCPIVTKFFDGDLKKATRNRIGAMLEEYANKDENVEDFIRLFTLYICNCILFPIPRRTCLHFIYHYINKVEQIGLLAWGMDVYEYLVSQMALHVIDSAPYFNGCTIGLLAWVNERLPSMGDLISVDIRPRLLRWRDSRILIAREEAE